MIDGKNLFDQPIKNDKVTYESIRKIFNGEVIKRSQQILRSNHHRIYTEEVNKIALSSNDDKRIQTFDKVTTYPYGTNVFKICENEMFLNEKEKRLLCTIDQLIIQN